MRADLLKKELGIYTYGQLLHYYPFRYIDRTRFYKISELHPDLPLVQIVGRITGKEVIGEKHKKRIVARFSDDSGTIELVWFQSLKWVDDNVERGKVYIAFGKPNIFNGQFSISHPELETYPRPQTVTGNLTLQPIYNSTEKLKKRFLDSKGIQQLQRAILEQHVKEIPENMPAYILEKYRLLSKREAMLNIHFPSSASALQNAQRRL